MKEFKYVITDPLGIHARPAGLLAKEAGRFQSVCTLTKGDTSRKLTGLMLLMSMGIKCGDEVTVRAEGADEDAAITALEAFFRARL